MSTYSVIFSSTPQILPFFEVRPCVSNTRSSGRFKSKSNGSNYSYSCVCFNRCGSNICSSSSSSASKNSYSCVSYNRSISSICSSSGSNRLCSCLNYARSIGSLNSSVSNNSYFGVS